MVGFALFMSISCFLSHFHFHFVANVNVVSGGIWALGPVLNVILFPIVTAMTFYM